MKSQETAALLLERIAVLMMIFIAEAAAFLVMAAKVRSGYALFDQRRTRHHSRPRSRR